MLKPEFSVDMTWEGSSKAIHKVLDKLGIVEFDIDLPNKKVCINSEHSTNILLEALGKTGKPHFYLGPEK
ncbi:copper transport protein ATOX1 [Ailuropoda melanoleuca]|uniref:Copper transport protein ATOX1 n=1 Tax=Ailuropoda melanoleuca TaxID=9646 RepID=G1LMQ6_AILME|nr:copper transport protein ATOX1 [Ailuropoda melanoleuca]